MPQARPCATAPGSAFISEDRKLIGHATYDVMFTANTWENSSAHIHSMGVMGKRSALTTSDFVNFAEDFVENPEKKILQVFDAVSKFQSLCVTYGIDKAISDKIQHVLDGLVTDDLNLLQLT